jgi:hypothetical protein
MRNTAGEALGIRRVIGSRYRSRVDRTIEDQYRSCCKGDTFDSFSFPESPEQCLFLPPQSTGNAVLFPGTHTGHRVKVESIVLLSHGESTLRARRGHSEIYRLPINEETKLEKEKESRSERLVEVRDIDR